MTTEDDFIPGKLYYSLDFEIRAWTLKNSVEKPCDFDMGQIFMFIGQSPDVPSFYHVLSEGEVYSVHRSFLCRAELVILK